MVDNGSTDGTAEAVRRQFSKVELIRSEVNLGFAEGNNVGMRRAMDLDCDFAMLLNNDTLVDPGLVGALVEEAGAARTLEPCAHSSTTRTRPT